MSLRLEKKTKKITKVLLLNLEGWWKLFSLLPHFESNMLDEAMQCNAIYLTYDSRSTPVATSNSYLLEL